MEGRIKKALKEVEEKRVGKRVVRKGWRDEEYWIMKKEVRRELREWRKKRVVKIQREEKRFQGIM